MLEPKLFESDPEVALPALRELLLRATARSAYVDVNALPSADASVGCVVRVTLGTSTVSTLIELGVARERVFGQNGLASAVIHGLYKQIMDYLEDGNTDSLSEPPNPPGNAVESSIADNVLRRLREDRDVHLVGPSASGKSIAATQVGARLESDGWRCIWIDLSDPSITAVRLLASVLRLSDAETPIERPILIVIDDVQSAPATAISCMNLVERLRTIHGMAIRILLVGWPISVNIAHRVLGNARRVPASSATVLVEMLNTPNYETFSSNYDDIEHVSGGDLIVARAIMEYMRQYSRVPSRSEVAEFAVSRVGDVDALSVGALRLLHWLACMGVFEIEAELSRITGMRHMKVTDAEVQELLQSRWIRHADRFVSVGHRTFATALKHVIELRHSGVIADQDRSAAEVAVRYLKSIGDSQILQTLNRLDLSSYTGYGEDPDLSSSLARCWSGAAALSRILGRQSGSDVTWSDNTASACFAAAVHFALGQTELGTSILENVRTRWDYGDGSALPANRDRPTADRVDFDEINAAMRIEDDVAKHFIRADVIDSDIFHRTWALGLLLGIEGAIPVTDESRVAILKQAAATTQEPSGAFYPARVPWITARVVLGMVSLGESIYTSEVVRRAVSWLRGPRPAGAFDDGFWRSGTGDWNTDLMTTSMVVLALVGAGVSPAAAEVKSGMEFLLSRRAEWIIQGGEIDGALALEAGLAASLRWQEYASELEHLLRWAQQVEAWESVGRLASDSHTESSKAPFVASSLVNISWRLVKRELPLLLQGIASEYAQDNSYDAYMSEAATTTFENIQSLLNFVEKEIAKRDEKKIKHPNLQSVQNTRNEYVAIRAELFHVKERISSATESDLSILDAEISRIADRVGRVGVDG